MEEPTVLGVEEIGRIKDRDSLIAGLARGLLSLTEVLGKNEQARQDLEAAMERAFATLPDHVDAEVALWVKEAMQERLTNPEGL
ncbi:hypothetical protein NK553_14725 [Pseudomonas sp. ZM23]|uniref:Uncharacterized protein n=1 Tax=Pseudomonas triclosanedens TaxID=2961893 RepID=A0ABY6ZWG3_9PSED|nr:hypothetical protein [Pseudomonas triclosanedens]MCP8465204.1 hypothetical protein [Pseudomonas triclosanedens]MCP8470856.1 hypothetical protein [Pseudomonas triclosanedens]MCP8476575.1 hypothetical protein [Pseudomonas triclosanedens]WAI49040.1 hypothetical protein OU419_25375 [Pseudomonas triclosanedens]